MKKTVIAVVIGFIVVAVGRFLLHAVVLEHQYLGSRDVFRPRPEFMHRVWMLYLADFLFAFAATLIYARGVESKPWLGQGIRFGILLALVTAVPQAITEYVVYPVHHELGLHWILGESAIAILLGIVIAAVCRPATSPA